MCPPERARARALISCAAVRLARPERAGLRPRATPRVPLEIAPLTASLSARVPRQVAPPRHARTVGARAPEAASGRDAARAHALAAPWPPALVPTHTPGPPRAARSVGASGVADRLSSIGRLGARRCARLNLARSRCRGRLFGVVLVLLDVYGAYFMLRSVSGATGKTPIWAPTAVRPA